MRRQEPQEAQETGSAGPAAQFMAVTEAAEELGVTPATVRRWLREGRIEGRKVGKQWRVSRSGLGHVIAPQEGASAPAPREEPLADAQGAQTALDDLLASIELDTDRAKALAAGIASEAHSRVRESEAEACGLLAQLLVASVQSRASEVHIEPCADCLRVRMRIDGALLEAAQLPRQFGRPLAEEALRWCGVSRAPDRLPQDGRFAFDFEARKTDVRLSTMPLTHGTAVTLRVLDPRALLPPIDSHGLEPDQLKRFRQTFHRPNGLIILTGPTGCGKTTTLYAALSELNEPSRKVMMAEDPVEYDLDGIDQAAIHPEIGFDFRRATIAMLRQGPDVIVIGEVRDREVGRIACKAALTGHLVFTTMHANDAPSVPVQLVKMGVEPSLVASALQCALAQRLVRLVCPDCKAERRPEADELDALGIEAADRRRAFYHGTGCPRCHMTGYRGRTGVYQLLDVDGGVREAIVKGKTDEIRKAGRAPGFCRSFREVGLQKLFRGETTVQEVLRMLAVASASS